MSMGDGGRGGGGEHIPTQAQGQSSRRCVLGPAYPTGSCFFTHKLDHCTNLRGLGENINDIVRKKKKPLICQQALVNTCLLCCLAPRKEISHYIYRRSIQQGSNKAHPGLEEGASGNKEPPTPTTTEHVKIRTVAPLSLNAFCEEWPLTFRWTGKSRMKTQPGLRATLRSVGSHQVAEGPSNNMLTSDIWRPRTNQQGSL